ncbi:MAG: hypothetical protein M5U26_21265 [Planctomycetota bacterium]|nr:hypothetical protein [Planctomycetota bacterium]
MESLGLFALFLFFVGPLSFFILAVINRHTLRLQVPPFVAFISCTGLSFLVWQVFKDRRRIAHRWSGSEAAPPVHYGRLHKKSLLQFRLSHLYLLVVESMLVGMAASNYFGFGPESNTTWLLALIQCVFVLCGLVFASEIQQAGERRGWSQGATLAVIGILAPIFVPQFMLSVYTIPFLLNWALPIMTIVGLLYWMAWLIVEAILGGEKHWGTEGVHLRKRTHSSR